MDTKILCLYHEHVQYVFNICFATFHFVVTGVFQLQEGTLAFRVNFNHHIHFPHTLLPVSEDHKYQHLTCWIIKVGTLAAIASTSNCWKVMSGYKVLHKLAESSSKVSYLHTVQHHACHHHPHSSQQVGEQHLHADRNGRLILDLSLGCFGAVLHRRFG